MKILKGYQPICLINDNLLLYKKGKLILYNESLNDFRTIVNLNSGFIKKIKESFRLSSRVFRTEIRSGLAVSQDEVLFSLDKNIYYLSINQKKVNKVFEIKRGFSDPLNLCRTLKESNYIALFGDYGDNSNRDEVSIYGICSDLSVHEIYTFEPGKIRHIHNIICDPYKHGYYIFTGDNEENSGIYWTDINFNIMNPILVGTQKARAVSGFVTDRGLLYATDSVSEQNKIYLLNEDKSDIQLQEVASINGSCIYGTEYSIGYVFSTTVESEETNGNRVMSLLSMKRGKGILSDDVHLVYVSPQLETKVIGTYKKDRLPYKLFQYGVIRFPSGLKNNETLIVYPCAVKGFDGNTVFFRPSIDFDEF